MKRNVLLTQWHPEAPIERVWAALRRATMIEGKAPGELNGKGRWLLGAAGEAAHVQYGWTVTTGKRWVNALAPVLLPVFRWNHNQVMAKGDCGLALHLGVRLVAAEDDLGGNNAWFAPHASGPQEAFA